MKRINKLLSFIVVFVVTVSLLCSISFAATVGQVLSTPESGWQRIDDSDGKFSYTGNWAHSGNSSWYNKTNHQVSDTTSTVSFKFYGSKLRILACSDPVNYSNNVNIIIDGITYSFSEVLSGATVYTWLSFEKADLTLGIHSAVLQNNINGKYMTLDAVDIDNTGYLVDSSVPTNLKAVSGNAKVDLSWDTITGATSYNIKRSTTAGGPYIAIASNVTETTYPDTTVTNGTKYYYVVSTTVSGTESANSNEVSVTPIAPVTPPDFLGNKAILEVTMTNGQIKEYDLLAVELDSFLKWYDDRAAGTGKSYFAISKKNNIKPFLSRKEYLQYDKIYSFEVKDYNE